MKRRDFLAVSIGTTLAARRGLVHAQGLPCPPPSLGADAGGQALNPCRPSADGAAVGPGTIMLVGTNSEDSVRPASHSASQWQYSLFASWSGGAFVPDWGTHGAYVCAGTGGHGAPENYGAVLFDFADYTWKYLPNTNGVAANPAPLAPGSTTQSPYWEIPGTQVPAPAHVYQHQIGVGSSVFWVSNTFATTSAAGGSFLHRCTLNPNLTCTWSRIGTNGFNAAFPGFGTYGGGNFAATFHDAARNRLWFLNVMTHWVSTIPWIALNGSNWTGTPVGSLTRDTSGAGILIHDPEMDCIFAGVPSGQLYRLNLSGSPLAGWTAVSSTGLSSSGLSGSGEEIAVRWTKYPVADGGDGCFYSYRDNNSRIIKRFDPATRVFSDVTVASGAAMPRINPGSAIYPNHSQHFTRFCYVPARKCFAWIPGNGQQVALLRP